MDLSPSSQPRKIEELIKLLILFFKKYNYLQTSLRQKQEKQIQFLILYSILLFLLQKSLGLPGYVNIWSNNM
ncbi:hypothetical protein BpHYR1_033047 [Brachionus plicatilis]|uniref:Uncharacterized protein n=1 Tax=Brachionus plicatilis TaxID=10195 RepID=A0A3M7PCS8_BRAPC|nr:hypothetical protein BpHYR1_033047 [Brachionus plicatilis]